jgi:hypothetical protein
MSTKQKHKDPAAPQQNVSTMPSKCTAEGCKKAPELLTFCKEHFDWFKFGLLTKEGKRPSDFDKKWQAFQKHKAA